MVTLAVHAFLHVAVTVLGQWLPRAFCAVCKRSPPAFAAVALLGMTLGAWCALVCWPGDPWTAALGVVILAGYTVALGVLVWKLLRGTWAAFCDHVAAQI